MEVAHIDAWRADPERFWHFYGNRFQSLEDKEPNGATTRSWSWSGAASSTRSSPRTSTAFTGERGRRN